MTYPSVDDIGRGDARGWSYVHVFGRHAALDGTLTPITNSGIFQTPQATGAKQLRIKTGGNANDTAAGSGAREITLVGMDASGDIITEAVATAGASASAATTQSFIRLFKVYVSASGTYATATAGSHAAAITIEASDGSADWAAISDTTAARGQSQIGVYTIPRGYTGYLRDFSIGIDATKNATLLLYKRTNILETAAPYSARILLEEFTGIQGYVTHEHHPMHELPALTDIGFMGYGSDAQPADASITFSLLLRVGS